MPLIRDSDGVPICPIESCQSRMYLKQGIHYRCSKCKKTATDSDRVPGGQRKPPKDVPPKVERSKPPKCPECGKGLLSGGKAGSRWRCAVERKDRAGKAGCGFSVLKKNFGLEG